MYNDIGCSHIASYEDVANWSEPTMTRKKPAPRDLQQPRQYPSTINDAGRAGAMLSRNQLLSSQTEQVVVDLPAGGNGPPAQSESSQRKKSENIFKVLRRFLHLYKWSYYCS